MSVTYSGIVGFGSGKVTLPSVDTWGSNMEIQRDPPKAIYTRKIDKVGETSEITQMIQESGDRFGEAVMVYARGVNPMVGVSYDNNGNNGGQRSGGALSAGMVAGGGNSGKQSFLPYRVMNAGAFRPPILDQRDLLPLSRLPRVWTSAYTQPGFADFSKKAMFPGSDLDTQGVRKPTDTLKAYARPTAVYQLQTPVVEPFEVKYVIKNPLHVSGFSGIDPHAKFNGQLGDPSKQIVDEPLRPEVHLNYSGQKVDGEATLDTEKYTHTPLQGEYSSNASRNIQSTSIEELYRMDTADKTKEQLKISYTAPQSSYDKVEYMHQDLELERRLPEHQARTNTGRNDRYQNPHQDSSSERIYTANRPSPSITTNVGGYQRTEDMNREYHLRPTINPGSFEGTQSKPQVYQENQIQPFDTQKVDMRKRIYDMQQDRSAVLNTIPYMSEIVA